VVDVYERERFIAAVRNAAPDAVLHQLTDLSARDSAANARLRAEGTRNLVDAVLAAGVRRLVAQSISWVYRPGPEPADESEPLDSEAPEPRRSLVEGVRALETASGEVETCVVVRYGRFYGPGTWYAPDGAIADQVRRGELVADESVYSFIHVDDAARAALLALSWPPGTYNTSTTSRLQERSGSQSMPLISARPRRLWPRAASRERVGRQMRKRGTSESGSRSTPAGETGSPA
jgi:nucleoside-diphosphate-sugar epimerase